MSVARQCDRCGDYYKSTAQDLTKDDFGFEVLTLGIVDKKGGYRPIENSIIDLCPHCAKQFKYWVTGRDLYK